MTTAIQPEQPSTAPRQPFLAWTLADAQGILAALVEARVTKQGYEQNAKYIERGDHWQSGSMWMGPRGSQQTEKIVLDRVQPQFTPVDVIGEVLDNLVNAVLGRSPILSLVPEDGSDPTDEQQKEIEGIVASLTFWAANRDLWTTLRKVVARSRWATWGLLRPWVPPSQLVTKEAPLASDPDTAPQQLPRTFFPTNLSLDEALERIEVSDPEPKSGAIYLDPETRDKVGILGYQWNDANVIELYWVDDQGLAHIKTMSDGAEKDTEDTLDLAGRLPVAQVNGDLLITESVRREQAQLDFFRSLLTRVAESAGFPERYTINAQPQGLWLKEPPLASDSPPVSKVDDAGQVWYLHPTNRTLGSAITTELVGIDVEESTTTGGVKRTLTTPEVIFKDPTDPDYLIRACSDGRLTILRSCKQAHLAMDDQLVASGRSRVQARSTFIADATNTARAVEYALADLLMTVLAYAALMSNDAKAILARYRVTVTIRVDAGPLDAGQRTEVLDQQKAGALSLETTLAQLGVEDVPGELARIRAEPESRIAWAKRVGDAMTALTTAGLGLVAAAKLCGLEGADLTIIEEDAANPPVPEPTPPPFGGLPPVPPKPPTQKQLPPQQKPQRVA